MSSNPLFAALRPGQRLPLTGTPALALGGLLLLRLART
jgi:hypothetical protein